MGGEMTFGQWIKDRRADLGMSLRDVERATEGVVSNATLSQIEGGKIARPSLVVAIHLAAVYAIPAEEMFERGRNGGKLPEPPPCCPTCGQMLPTGRQTLTETDNGR